MQSSTMTAKGKTTIPRDIRDKLSLKPGDRILYIEEDGQVRIVAANLRARDLKGLLPRPERPMSLEEMNRVIANAGRR